MNQSNLKNMVVLKNLPSNLVEEAIIILKSNRNIKNLEKIEINKISEDTDSKKREKDYILKEAEMLVANYISSLEKRKQEPKNNNKKMEQKYKRIKNYAFTVSLIIVLETIMLFA